MFSTKFIFDFDSTFISVESLDILSELSFNEKLGLEIKRITNLCMEGKMSFKQGLIDRLQLLNINRTDIYQLVDILKTKITKSFVKNRKFFESNTDNIYIISNGFIDIIAPIVMDYGIKYEHILANSFIYKNDNVIGFDETNELCENNGKSFKLKQLKLEGEIIAIGDGYTDYEMWENGAASKFYAFIENINRPTVVEKTMHIASSLDDILNKYSYKASLSYPKNRIKVLCLENIHQNAVDIFQQEGYDIEIIKTALDEDELCEKIKNVSILGIRSKTQITKKVLLHANKLLTIGAFCIGTNQIDLENCTKRGISVFNAPYSNTRSVVELAIGQMIMLMRNTFEKSQNLHLGKWDKSSNNSFEIRGKNLGIVGYGNIGTQLSVLGEALGMKIYYYDIVDRLALGNATKCDTLNELLSISDIVSLHVDGRKENTNIISDKEFEQMKYGAVFLNLARGHLVNLDALIKNLQNGKIKSAAIDVFPIEPKNNNEIFVNVLCNLKNVILTPHVGGSTEEAQENIGNFVANKIIQFINTGATTGSVNLPEIQLAEVKNHHRIIHIHENVKGILAQINHILANNNINILGQHLKTNDNVGYVITDIESTHSQELENILKSIPNTIKFRILY